MTRRSAFLSYSSRDSEFAETLQAGLTRAGIDIWFAPSKIEAGDIWQGQITKGIENSDFLILLASSSSIGNRHTGKEHSKEVHRELSLFDKKKGKGRLIPLDLDGVLSSGVCCENVEYLLEGLHYYNCQAAYESNEVGSVCDVVLSLVEQDRTGNESQGFNTGSNYEKKLEQFLIDGDQASALQYITTRPKLDDVDPTVRLLEIIVDLSCKPLRDLSLEHADEVANTLATWLNNDSLTKQSAVMAFYCLGALVYEFYERNALRSPVGDFQTVKRISKSAGVPLSRTRRLLAGVSRNSDAFNRRWLL